MNKDMSIKGFETVWDKRLYTATQNHHQQNGMTCVSHLTLRLSNRIPMGPKISAIVGINNHAVLIKEKKFKSHLRYAGWYGLYWEICTTFVVTNVMKWTDYKTIANCNTELLIIRLPEIFCRVDRQHLWIPGKRLFQTEAPKRCIQHPYAPTKKMKNTKNKRSMKGWVGGGEGVRETALGMCFVFLVVSLLCVSTTPSNAPPLPGKVCPSPLCWGSTNLRRFCETNHLVLTS